jgi:glutamyl-tRNA reductase
VEWTGPGGDVAGELSALVPAGGRRYVGEDAARHAIAVAVGLDSVVVGEDQVLHQLRRSVAEAQAGGRLDPVVDRLFSLALRAGRRARSWRLRPSRSLADVAFAAAEARIGPVRGRPLLVVGSGEMGRLAAVAAATAGCHVSISSRTPGRAGALASELHAAPVGFDPGATAGHAAVVVVALRGPWSPSAATVDALVGGSAIVVDLSVPPAIDPAVAERLGDRLIGVDSLAAGQPDRTDGSGSLARERALVDSAFEEYRVWLDGRGRRAAASALADRAEQERRAELDDLWRRLPGLEPEAREAIERMSRHLVGRLLRDPVERLGQDTDGTHEQAVRDLWAL